MKISVYGSGYVGLVAAACFADSGNDVVCMDANADRVGLLLRGEIPFYEPGLADLVSKNLRSGRLAFCADHERAIASSPIHFIAVGTPSLADGSADLSHVFDVAGRIGEKITGYNIIVNKSTVPVSTAGKVGEIVRSRLRKRGEAVDFSVVSNPEFLREGSALKDFLEPERIVVGVSSPQAKEWMRELYLPFVKDPEQIMFMDAESAEMAKYVANAFLSTKISFINEISNLCDLLGADIDAVKAAIGKDSRIGGEFLNPGVGFGGSCFPKDVSALISTGKRNGVSMALIESVEGVNRRQKLKLREKLLERFQGNIAGLKLAVWGLAFKPCTDDVREAPAIPNVEALLKDGASVRAYDPEALSNAEAVLRHPSIEFIDNPYEVLRDVDALLIFTEWREFGRPDFNKMKTLMKTPLVFDGRNVFIPSAMARRGFTYVSIGRPSVSPARETKD